MWQPFWSFGMPDAEQVLVLTLDTEHMKGQAAVYRDRIELALEGRQPVRLPMMEACSIADVVHFIRTKQQTQQETQAGRDADGGHDGAIERGADSGTGEEGGGGVVQK